MTYLHQIDPIALSLGPIKIHWYGLMYLLAFASAWWLGRQRIRAGRLPGTDANAFSDLLFYGMLGVVLGGRIGYILFYSFGSFLENPLSLFKVWEGGMSFHGGALGVLIAVFGFSYVNKIDVLRLGDAVTACAPIGLFFGRIANFINGELWGRPSDVPWAFIFPQADGVTPRHPSQLYEAALEGVVLFLILRWATHRAGLLQRRGVVAGIFLLGYAVFRTFVENFREPDRYLQHFPFGLTMGMMLSAPMVIGGLFLIWRGMREPLATEAAPPPGQAKTETP